MFGEYFKGKIYTNKYYEKTFEDSKDSIFFGLNTGYGSISKNIACILNNYQEFVNDFSENKNLLDNFPENIYNCLLNEKEITKGISYHIDKDGIELILNIMERKEKSIKGKYPIKDSNYIKEFLEKKKIKESLETYYPCFQVSQKELLYILQKKKIIFLLKKNIIKIWKILLMLKKFQLI